MNRLKPIHIVELSQIDFYPQRVLGLFRNDFLKSFIFRLCSNKPGLGSGKSSQLPFCKNPLFDEMSGEIEHG